MRQDRLRQLGEHRIEPVVDVRRRLKEGPAAERTRAEQAQIEGEQADFGVQAERYHQALQDNAKLHRKVRQLQEQRAITSAKKDARV